LSFLTIFFIVLAFSFSISYSNFYHMFSIHILWTADTGYCFDRRLLCTAMKGAERAGLHAPVHRCLPGPSPLGKAAFIVTDQYGISANGELLSEEGRRDINHQLQENPMYV